MSFAFTLTASTNFFTRETSPLRQASKSSRKAPLPPLLPPPESGVEPGLLLPLASVVVGELALLLAPLLPLLLVVRAGAGEAAVLVVGEAGATSPSAVSIAPLCGKGQPSSPTGNGEPGGLPGREELRGGEDGREFSGGCCCCCWRAERRGVAIFHNTTIATSNNNTVCWRLPVEGVDFRLCLQRPAAVRSEGLSAFTW